MTLQQLKEQEIAEVIKEIVDSEPMKRLLGIESIAIITGRASQYHGKVLSEVIKDALSSRHLRLEQAIREDERSNIDEIIRSKEPNGVDVAFLWRNEACRIAYREGYQDAKNDIRTNFTNP